MTIALFTAEASLYRSANTYSSTWSEGSRASEVDAIAPAYFPGPATQHNCNNCLERRREVD